MARGPDIVQLVHTEGVFLHAGYSVVRDRMLQARLAGVEEQDALEMAFDSIVLAAGYKRKGEIYVKKMDGHPYSGVVGALCEERDA